MKSSFLSTARAALAAALLLSFAATHAVAGAADYEFQPLATELKVGPSSEFAVTRARASPLPKP